VGNTLKNRRDVAQEDRWRIEVLYRSDVDWETDYQACQDMPERVGAYHGRLAESEEVLAEALRVWFEANRRIEKVWVYAHLRNDEDLGNSHYQSMMERARSTYVRLSTAGSYIAPEILVMEGSTIAAWLEGETLAPYRVWLEDLLRGKPHTLSQAEERLMSMVSEPLAALPKVFSVLKNVDLAARLPDVTDEKGEKSKLSHAFFIKSLESHDRTVRKAAFDAYYREFQGNRNTIAAALDGTVKVHVFEAKARNFSSALTAALFDDNVDPSVYEALISAVHNAFPAFYRYIDLRKRLLGLKKLHMYDVYALSGWVDRYENVGKRSGAYSSGCYDSMPYILLNFTGTLDSVYTLAHELGHSMHSLYSNHAQPYHLADYRILVAEVASTTNESLLTHYLLSITDDRATRAYLIDRYLDALRGTLFRQTMFAEYEQVIHEQVEAGNPLTADYLDATYYALTQSYFGDGVAFDEQDEAIASEWSRVDHFFYDFYVYKYATGISSAIAIASDLLSDGKPALDRYLSFLNSAAGERGSCRV